MLLILLTIPAPRSFRRGVLVLVQRTFELNLAGTFKLLHVMLVITGCALVATARATLFMENGSNISMLPPNVQTGVLAKKW